MALRRQQSGATLMVGLVLLLVLTVLGVSGMNTATVEITMAGNTQFQQDAFQMAEDGIDLVIARREYTTEGPRTIPWLGGNPAFNRQATSQFRLRTPVIDLAFSSEVEAFHFDVESVGIGPRNATATHTQSFYVIARAL